MKISKTTKKRILKLILSILIISILVISFTSVSFAEEESSGLVYYLGTIDQVRASAFDSLLLWFFRAIIVAFVFVATGILSILLGSQVIAFNVETFIFNKFNLTSLKMFTGGSRDTLSDTFVNPIAKWFVILFGLAILLEIIVLIYIAINSVIKSLRHDPKKGYEVKNMMKNFILGIVVLFGMGIFIIAVITLNNTIVSILANATGMSSALHSLTNKVALDVLSVDATKGTVAMLMYIILATMGFVFFSYYLKRLLKVSFLILLSPIVAVTFAIDRTKGGAKQLITWTKMFVFTVFIQSVHALLYVSLIAVVAMSIEGNSTSFIPSMVIAIAGLKFIWDAEEIITRLFDMPVDKVQNSAALVVGFLSQAGSIGGKAKEAASKLSKLKTDSDFAKGRKFNVRRASGSSDSLKLKDRDRARKLIKDSDKSKLRDERKVKLDKDKLRDSKKKISRKDIDKVSTQKKRAIKSSKVNTRKSPLRSLGKAMGQSAKIQGKNLSKRLLKGAAKTLGGALFAVASHATPKYSMFEAGIAGAAATGATMDGISNLRRKSKYRGKKYEKETLTEEAEQLNAIMDRREKLGKDPELDQSSEGKKLEGAEKEIEPAKEDKRIEEGKEKETKEDKKIEEVKEEELEPAKETEPGEDETEAYAKTIMSTAMDELEKAYEDARERCVDEIMRKSENNAAQAMQYINNLQKDLLDNKDFSYKLLEEADRNLLHRYLDLITKQKINHLEANRREAVPREHLHKEYNKVIKRAGELRANNQVKD